MEFRNPESFLPYPPPSAEVIQHERNELYKVMSEVEMLMHRSDCTDEGREMLLETYNEVEQKLLTLTQYAVKRGIIAHNFDEGEL